MSSTSHDIPSEVEPRKTSFLSPIFCIAIIVITTLATLWPVVKCDFTHMDDDETVAQNQHVYPASLGGIVHIWTHAAMGLYVPVTYTVWSVIGWISGPGDALAAHPQPDPALFHAANLLIHVIASLVVFAILRRMLCHDFAACLGALFFAIHPVQVEPVAWVSGLKDVLSGLFSLVAIWQYLAFVDAPRRARAHAAILVVLVAAGIGDVVQAIGDGFAVDPCDSGFVVLASIDARQSPAACCRCWRSACLARSWRWSFSIRREMLRYGSGLRWCSIRFRFMRSSCSGR